MNIEDIRANARVITNPSEAGLGLNLDSFEALGEGYGGLVGEFDTNRKEGPGKVLGALPGADEVFIVLHDDEKLDFILPVKCAILDILTR